MPLPILHCLWSIKNQVSPHWNCLDPEVVDIFLCCMYVYMCLPLSLPPSFLISLFQCLLNIFLILMVKIFAIMFLGIDLFLEILLEIWWAHFTWMSVICFSPRKFFFGMSSSIVSVLITLVTYHNNRLSLHSFVYKYVLSLFSFFFFCINRQHLKFFFCITDYISLSILFCFFIVFRYNLFYPCITFLCNMKFKNTIKNTTNKMKDKYLAGGKCHQYL